MEFNGTFLATIITFLVFVFLMNKVLYAPILNIMEARKNFIDENYKNAEDNNLKSIALSQEKEDKLSDAKNDAREKYLETLEEFKSQKANIVGEAQASSKDEFEHSKDELSNLSNEVKENLKGKMTDLANDIVEKVIGYRSEVSGFDNDKINEVLYH